MTFLPRCTCDRYGSGFGEFSEACPRHAHMAKWLRERREQHAIDLINLRKQALTRPAHGGYPGVVR